jgi:alkyl hydroperoxide reductase subunit AhpF
VSPLGEREQGVVSEVLSRLDRPVALLLELGPEEMPVTVLAGGREIDFGAETRALLEDITALSENLTLEVSETTEPGRYPAITIGGGLRYLGLPWGYELATLVGGIAEAGRAESGLSADSRAALATIERAVALDVYVTPT